VINDKGTVIYSDPVYVQCLWKKAGQLPQPLSFQNVLAHNNYFYILGGWIFDWDFIPALDIFWKYDPVNNTTQEYSPSLVHPFYLSSTVVYNGKFYALGGLKKKSGKGCARNEWVDIYSPAGSYDYGDIRSISSTAYVRGGAAYSRIGNTVYLFGGNDNDGNPTDTILTYNLDTDTWSDTGLRLDHPRAYASAVQYNGKIFIFAGKTDSGYSRSVTIFDPPSTLVRLDDRLKYSRGGAGVVRVNHKVYLLGGEGEGGYLNAVEVFNLDTYVSYELRKMPFSLGYMGAAAYEDKILIFGGKNEDGFYSKSDIYHYHPLEDDLNITN
jgi:N-acetylneuraminic acid mutarotase